MTSVSRWQWQRWQAPALLGVGMGLAWATQLWWVTLVGVLGYILVLLFDGLAEGFRPFGREASGLAAGMLAVVSAALITGIWRPIAFPLNFLLSLALGGAIQFGVRNMLAPDAPPDLIGDQAAAEYQGLLAAMQAVAERLAAASRQPALPKATMRQLTEISSLVEQIASRYQQRPADFVSASATLTILQQFDKILAYYRKIKTGEQFVAPEAKRREIAETEDRTIPMIRAALGTLGKQLDAGEVLDKHIAEEALESMLHSLNLIEELQDSPEAALAARGAGKQNLE